MERVPSAGTKRGFPIAFIAAVPIIVFVVLVAGNCISPFPVDHRSPMIAATSWVFVRGEPVYHELNAATRCVLPYGPMVYLINGALLRLMGPSLISAKIGGCLGALLGLLLSYLVFRKAADFSKAITLTGVLALYLAFYKTRSFWPGPDSFLFCCVSLGLWSVMLDRRILPALLCGFALGVALNLKLHAFLYFIPVLTLLTVRKGLGPLLASFAMSSLVAALPFLLPNVSFSNMVAWYLQYSKHGIDVRLLTANPLFLAFLLAPAVLYALYFICVDSSGFRCFLHADRSWLGSLAISAVAVSAVGTKVGAGPHHLIPLIPLILFTVVRMKPSPDPDRSSFNRWIIAAVAILSVPVLAKLAIEFGVFVRTSERTLTAERVQGRAVLADLQAIERAEGNGSIAVGYGGDSTYDLTRYRPVLVFRGNPYLVDAPALMDMQLAGMKIPQRTLSALTSGRIKLWLIPKGDVPFSLESYYGPFPVFDEDFQKEFLRNYTRRGQSRFFDLWYFDPH